jgi:hypothetical protein
MAVVSGGVVYGLTALARVSISLSRILVHRANKVEIPRPSPPASFYNGIPINLSRDNGSI